MEYTFDSSPTEDFGTPTCAEDIIQTGAEPANKDRSKSSALIPPGFGTPTGYLPNSGEYLNPNLAADGPPEREVHPHRNGRHGRRTDPPRHG